VGFARFIWRGTVGALPFPLGPADEGDLRCSCRTGPGDVQLTAEWLTPEVRSCRTGLGDAAPAGGAALAGGISLPCRADGSAGRWVLRLGFPALPDWMGPGAGVAAVFGAAPVFSRRVERVLPGLGVPAAADSPPGWGGRGATAGGAFCAEAPRSTVTLVCWEVWLLLCMVLPPTVWAVLWVERADEAPPTVPAAPG